jgi:hypothetical protein
MEKNEKGSRGQSVQFLFTMLLFFAIAICALFTILFGAQVYENIGDRMNENFRETTPLSYVANKIRQADEVGMVSIVDMEGTNVLKIDQVYGEDTYNTFIYYKEGQIKELFCREDSGLTLEDGIDIMESDGIRFMLVQKNLLKVKTNDENGGAMLLTLRSEEANYE